MVISINNEVPPGLMNVIARCQHPFNIRIGNIFIIGKNRKDTPSFPAGRICWNEKNEIDH
jgi:hypothetical protein